jgi:hypothetical protein
MCFLIRALSSRLGCFQPGCHQQQQEGHPHHSHYRHLSSPPGFHRQPRTPPTSSAARRPPHPSMSACDPPAMPRSPPACQQTLLASIETSDPTRLSRHDDRLHEKDRGGAKKKTVQRGKGRSQRHKGHDDREAGKEGDRYGTGDRPDRTGDRPDGDSHPKPSSHHEEDQRRRLEGCVPSERSRNLPHGTVCTERGSPPTFRLLS